MPLESTFRHAENYRLDNSLECVFVLPLLYRLDATKGSSDEWTRRVLNLVNRLPDETRAFTLTNYFDASIVVSNLCSRCWV
jgi:hypothetical protein